MRKTTKSLLSTALILFSTGLLIALCSFLFVKINRIDPYGMPHIAKTVENKTVSINDILGSSPKANYVLGVSSKKFTKIDISSYAGKVVVKSTDQESYIQLDNTNTANLSYSIDGETLIIKEIDPVGFFGIYIDNDGFSFKGLRQIFGPGNSANTGKTVTVYVNQAAEISQISVNSAIGDVEIEDVTANTIAARASCGNIAVKNTTVTDGKLVLAGDLCDIFMENNHYPGCTVSTKFGSVQALIPEGTEQSTILEIWLGKATIHTALPTTYYKLSISAMIGTITRNGENAGKAVTESSSTTNRITASVIFGNTSISYAGDNEADYVPKSDIVITEPETTDIPPESSAVPSETTAALQN